MSVISPDISVIRKPIAQIHLLVCSDKLHRVMLQFSGLLSYWWRLRKCIHCNALVLKMPTVISLPMSWTVKIVNVSDMLQCQCQCNILTVWSLFVRCHWCWYAATSAQVCQFTFSYSQIHLFYKPCRHNPLLS